MTTSKELREMFSPFNLMSQVTGNQHMVTLMTEILDRLETLERMLNGKEAGDDVQTESRQGLKETP